MIDAYTHLDLSVPDPIADFQARMSSTGVKKALAVEMWSGANFPLLETIAHSRLRQFRIVPCFRPEKRLPDPELLSDQCLVGVRVKTADISHLEPVASSLEQSQKWFVAHAEKGIGHLVHELVHLRGRHPGLRLYVPHLGWPCDQQTDDPEWVDAMTALSRFPGTVVGISAIAHFSREPYPHKDVRKFVSRIAELFPAENIVPGSDYPMMEKEQYAKYMELAAEWVPAVSDSCPLFETTAVVG